MGLFDIFKKKKANDDIKPSATTSSSTRPTSSYSTTSQSPRTTSKPSVARVSDMVDFGLKWQKKFVETCISNPTPSVQAEALMFTCWRVWYHCLENNKVSRDQAYLYDFFAHLMAHLQDYYAGFEDVEIFMPLFKNRYGIFRADLVGLSNSNYPVTKQYLPISTYRVFCTEPLELIDPSTSTISSLSMEQMDEMTEFVGKFIKVANAMSKELMDTF